MLQSVQKALQVFETVAKSEPIGVSEIARQLNISKSTAQRCLHTLREVGWIEEEVLIDFTYKVSVFDLASN